jgi:peptidoglycan/LPS O-acetylase OafA/YrhL
MNERFRIPALDGLRAVAALIVFFSHLGLQNIIPGGFGVSLFFFLSGYLITTLLRREYDDSGTLNFKAFYLRRLYRIAPPMYLILSILLTLASLNVIESSLTLGGIAAGFLQFTNYYSIFVSQEHLIPSTQTLWSLSVEEHFYLLFPFIFLLLVKRYTYTQTAAVLSVICLGELIWRIMLVEVYEASPVRTYWASDTRMDSLLFGCILALWKNPVVDSRKDVSNSMQKKVLLLIASFIGLLFSLLYRDEVFRESFRYTLQGISLLPLFWLAVRHVSWPVFRWLEWRSLRFFGSISYTFYLCHVFWLHLFYSVFGSNELIVGPIAFIASVLFSVLVYKLIEAPFARLRLNLHRNSGKRLYEERSIVMQKNRSI